MAGTLWRLGRDDERETGAPVAQTRAQGLGQPHPLAHPGQLARPALGHAEHGREGFTTPQRGRQHVAHAPGAGCWFKGGYVEDDQRPPGERDVGRSARSAHSYSSSV
ncbi:hypothetical protein ACFV23_51300 [Streptomyces sp. NPDC059627]